MKRGDALTVNRSWMVRGVALAALGLGASGCVGGFHSGPMPGEPKNATYAEIDGARVRYTDRGSGPAVVLIHGFASALDTWVTVMPELERDHRVIALDLKGFGWTDRPEGDYSPAAEARLVWGLLTERGVDKADVVAHSWGSSVALSMALMAPERVTRLALYDAWVFEEQLPSFFLWSRADGLGELLFGLFYKERPDEKMAHAFYDQRFVSQGLIDEVEKALDRPGTVAAALAAVRGQHYAQVQPRYRTIQQPTLLLWGREDEVTTLPFGERLSRELPHSRLVVYPRCGHFPMLEAKDASNAELTAFLSPATMPGAGALPAPATNPAPGGPPEKPRSNSLPSRPETPGSNQQEGP